jgi:hypothetical protein
MKQKVILIFFLCFNIYYFSAAQVALGKWNNLTIDTIDSFFVIKKGKKTIHTYLNDVEKSGNFLIATDTTGRKGVMDDKGKIILPFRYIIVNQPLSDYWIVCQENCGVLHTNQKTIIPLKYASIRYENELFAAQHDNEQWQIFDLNGKLWLKDSLQFIQSLKKTAVIAAKNYQFAVLKPNEKTIFKYQKIEKKADNTWQGIPYPQWLVLQLPSQQIDTLLYEKVQIWHRNNWIIQTAFGVGLFNKNSKKWHIEPYLESITPYTNHWATLKEKDEKLLTIADTSGTILAKNVTHIQKTHGNWFKVHLNQLENLLDSNGKWLFEQPQQKIITLNKHRVAIKQSNGLFRLYDNNAKPITENPFLLDTVERINEHYLKATYKGKQAILDSLGGWLHTPQYEKVFFINDSTFLAKDDFLQGYRSLNYDETIRIFCLDSLLVLNSQSIGWCKQGKMGAFSPCADVLFAPIYQTIYPTPNDSALIADSSEYKRLRALPSDTVYRLEKKFTKLFAWQPELTPFRINQSFGFTDHRARIRVAHRYDSVQLFSQGMAAVLLKGKWGYITESEELTVQPLYEAATTFQTKATAVKKNGKWGLIAKNGKELTTFVYDEINYINHDLFEMKQQGKKGVLNVKGEVIANPLFDQIIATPSGYILVERNKKWGLLDAQGRQLIAPIYANLRYENGYLLIKNNFFAETLTDL